ncbi:unnamed protein product [Moneuplotes crassus]|uniref:Bax inhibitor 1 n=1 Tax=Euplotes crassus TaxID=5936 RepID=A0AAD2CW84_EUPCR|nr:unnamed protein product [Moneuplotes crassus]
MEFFTKQEKDTVMQFTDISPRVRQHLCQVYATLCIGCLCAATACMWTPSCVTKLIVEEILFSCLCVGLILALAFVMLKKGGNNDQFVKSACFFAISFISGIGLRPLVDRAAEVDPIIVTNALVYTGSLFGTFTFFSLTTERRKMLFIGGFIGSIWLGISTTYLISWIFEISLVDYLQYNILILACLSLFVIYNTQLIVEKASMGDYDYTIHATELFIVLLRIFIKIVVILIILSMVAKANSDKKKKEKDGDSSDEDAQ